MPSPTVVTDSYTSEAIVAAIAAVVGGISVKLFDRWFARSDQREIDSRVSSDQIRKELWDEIHKLRDDILKVHKELDLWRDKYYQLVAENLSLEKRISDLTGELSSQRNLVEHLRRKLRDNDRDPDNVDDSIDNVV